MSRSSSEIRENITNLEEELETQRDRLNDIRSVKYFLNTAYVSQVNEINTEIGYLYDNLLEGVLNGTGDTNTLKSKHELVNDYEQKHSDSDDYLSIALSDLETEEANINVKITSLESSISSEWTAYYNALEEEEDDEDENSGNSWWL